MLHSVPQAHAPGVEQLVALVHDVRVRQLPYERQLLVHPPGGGALRLWKRAVAIGAHVQLMALELQRQAVLSGQQQQAALLW